MLELSHVEQVALAGAIKDTALKNAKAGIPDGSATPVDFRVHIVGSVQKGTRSLDATVEIAPTVSLRSLAVFCSVLRALGIGQKRLAQAYAMVSNEVAADTEFESLIAAEESKRAAKLKPVKSTTPGRAGSVQTQVTASKLP